MSTFLIELKSLSTDSDRCVSLHPRLPSCCKQKEKTWPIVKQSQCVLISQQNSIKEVQHGFLQATKMPRNSLFYFSFSTKRENSLKAPFMAVVNLAKTRQCHLHAFSAFPVLLLQKGSTQIRRLGPLCSMHVSIKVTQNEQMALQKMKTCFLLVISGGMWLSGGTGEAVKGLGSACRRRPIPDSSGAIHFGFVVVDAIKSPAPASVLLRQRFRFRLVAAISITLFSCMSVILLQDIAQGRFLFLLC